MAEQINIKIDGHAINFTSSCFNINNVLHYS